MENNENLIAVQFNGWNFGYIYDLINNSTGLYTSDFKESIEVLGKTMHRNDWLVKGDDGSFEIMSNLDYQNRLDEEYKRS